MGEQKRREERQTPIERMAIDMARQLAGDGKIIEGGWVAFNMVHIPAGAPPEVRAYLRLAYMAGAEHLFSSIMATLDEDREPTDADMRRMDLIDAEITRWREEYARDHYLTRGNT